MLALDEAEATCTIGRAEFGGHVRATLEPRGWGWQIDGSITCPAAVRLSVPRQPVRVMLQWRTGELRGAAWIEAITVTGDGRTVIDLRSCGDWTREKRQPPTQRECFTRVRGARGRIDDEERGPVSGDTTLCGAAVPSSLWGDTPVSQLRMLPTPRNPRYTRGPRE